MKANTRMIPVPDRPLGILFLLLAAAMLMVAAFFLFEAWALLTTNIPITFYARDLSVHHPRWIVAIASLLALTLGLLLGHLWD